jgi:hypothetical protein
MPPSALRAGLLLPTGLLVLVLYAGHARDAGSAACANTRC